MSVAYTIRSIAAPRRGKPVPIKRKSRQEPTPEDFERGRQFAAWFRRALKVADTNPSRLEKIIDISSGYLYDLLNDGIKMVDGLPNYKRPSPEVVRAIADATGANPNEGLLAAGWNADASPPVPSVIAALPAEVQQQLAMMVQALRISDMVMIPIVGRVSAGEHFGVFAEAHTRERVPIPRSMMRRSPEGEVFAVRVQGACLVGAHILPGDLIICRQAVDAEDGEIVVVIMDDQAVAKRLRKMPNGINGNTIRWLETAEADGAVNQVDLDANDVIRIIGVKIGLFREG